MCVLWSTYIQLQQHTSETLLIEYAGLILRKLGDFFFPKKWCFCFRTVARAFYRCYTCYTYQLVDIVQYQV